MATVNDDTLTDDTLTVNDATIGNNTSAEQPNTGPQGTAENPELKLIETMFKGGNEKVVGDLTVTVKTTGTKEAPTVKVTELKKFEPKTSNGGGTRGGKKRRKKRRSTKKKRKQKQKKRAK
jgi:hypothetical protein